MKKIVGCLVSLSLLLSAEETSKFQVYFSKTKNIELKDSKKTEVFFGKYNDFLEKNSQDMENLAKSMGGGLVSGLGTSASYISSSASNVSGNAIGQGSIMGLGIGLVYGAIGMGYTAYKKNEYTKYILVNDFENSKGEKTRVLTYFKSDELSDEKQIKTILETEEAKGISL